VLLTPRGDDGLTVLPSSGAPAMQLRTSGELTARIWERSDIPQSASETAMPPALDLLPTVRVVPPTTGGWTEFARRWRDVAVGAAQAGPRVRELAAAVPTSAPAEARARQLYRLAQQRVVSSEGEFTRDVASAEETLANRSGSRTLVLLSAARLAGLDAELLLARRAGAAEPSPASAEAYTRPLVRFRFGAQATIVDVESDGFGFGQLPPEIAHDALLVGELSPMSEPAEQIVALNQPAFNEQSSASAELTIADDGSMRAQLRITLGRWRATQVRTSLRGISPTERQHFFEQLAGRVFPGVTEATGEARGEELPEQPLELVVSCRARHFIAPDAIELDTMTPALGLRRMYATSADRQYPLVIDSVLLERSTFRVHLPPGMRVAQLPRDEELRSEFGSYRVAYSTANATEFSVTRSFNVPPQTIAPAKYPEFARFAERTEAAERQRIAVEHSHASAAGN
jgi:hypothetical protein